MVTMNMTLKGNIGSSGKKITKEDPTATM